MLQYAAAFSLIVSSLMAMILRTPSWSWMPTEITQFKIVLLDTGLALTQDVRIRLLGIARSGAVVAIVYPTAGAASFPSDGRLIIWRRLSLGERLRAKYGVSF